MASKYKVILSIRNDKHVMDKLKDLLGEEMIIDRNFMSPPIADDDIDKTFISFVTRQYADKNIPVIRFSLKDGTPCQFPSDLPCATAGFMNKLYEIMKTKTIGTLQEAIDEWIVMKHEDFGRPRFALDYTVKLTILGIPDELDNVKPQKPTEIGDLIEWVFITNDPRPAIVDKISGILGYGSHITMSFANHYDEISGIYICDNGKVVAAREHGMFFKPDLDIAMHRGITEEEYIGFLNEEAGNILVDDINANIARTHPLLFDLLDTSLGNPYFFEKMEPSSQLRVIIPMLLIGDLSNEKSVNFINKAMLSHEHFDQGLLLTLRNSGLFDGETLLGITEMIVNSRIPCASASPEIDSLAELIEKP